MGGELWGFEVLEVSQGADAGLQIGVTGPVRDGAIWLILITIDSPRHNTLPIRRPGLLMWAQ